mmetsp:Transcript_733/g.1277  ORF Transcript_733/g.1277 Transcript_733/m.1277 type:complete len:583 (-) Transcript_733:92-1840(-)
MPPHRPPTRLRLLRLLLCELCAELEDLGLHLSRRAMRVQREVGLDSLHNGTGADDLGDRLDVGGHVAVDPQRRHLLADQRVHGLKGVGSLERSEVLQSLARGKDLDCHDRFDVAHRLESLARCEAAHAHVVLFCARGRDRVDGRRMREDLVLTAERRRGAVGNHEARVEAGLVGEESWQTAQRGVDQPLEAPLGYVTEFGHADREIIEHLGGVLAVEVASADDEAVAGVVKRVRGSFLEHTAPILPCCLLILEGGIVSAHDLEAIGPREDHRVIRRTVQLDVEHATHEADGVVDDAVNLRAAAEAVGVLNLPRVVVRAVHLRERREKADESAGHLDLALVRPDRVDARFKAAWGTLESLDRQRACDVGTHGHVLRAGDRVRTNGGHELGAIDHCQALLCLQRNRREALPSQDLSSFANSTCVGVPHRAFAHQSKRQVREGREVTAGAHRALRRHHRHAVCVERGDHLVESLRSNARVALRQHVNAQGEQATSLLPRDGIADTRAVGADQVVLEVGQLVVFHHDVGEEAKSGIDTVCHMSLIEPTFDEVIDHLASAHDFGHRVHTDLDAGALPSQLGQLAACE